MWVNQQSDEDIEYVNNSLDRISPLDPLFPYLFYRNKDVQKHNEKMLIHVNEELIVHDAIDENEIKEIGYEPYEETIRFP